MPADPLPEPLAGLRLDHVAIAVADLGAKAAWPLLGLVRVGEDEEVASQGVRVRMLAAGDALVELIAPTSTSSPLTRFLERRGPGLHHLALRVDDLDAAMARLADLGARFVDEAPRPGRAGTRVAFLHPSWTGGTLVELVERV